MRRFFPRKRLAMALSTFGIALIGVDLTITRTPFVHVGELMVASLLCLAAGLALDRSAATAPVSAKTFPPPKNPENS